MQLRFFYVFGVFRGCFWVVLSLGKDPFGDGFMVFDGESVGVWVEMNSSNGLRMRGFSSFTFPKFQELISRRLIRRNPFQERFRHIGISQASKNFSSFLQQFETERWLLGRYPFHRCFPVHDIFQFWARDCKLRPSQGKPWVGLRMIAMELIDIGCCSTVDDLNLSLLCLIYFLLWSSHDMSQSPNLLWKVLRNGSWWFQRAIRHTFKASYPSSNSTHQTKQDLHLFLSWLFLKIQ